MKKMIMIAALMLSTTAIASPVFAHDEEKPATAETPAISNKAALKTLHDGVAYMSDASSEKNRANLFAEGSVMEKWHGIYSDMQDAAKAIEHNGPASKKERAPQKTALHELLQAVDDFHMATHDKDKTKTLAEVKRAQDSLRLLEKTMK